MSVNHRRPDIRMTQQLLQRPDVIPILQQMRCARMSYSAARCHLGDPCIAHCPLHHGFVKVVPALLTPRAVPIAARRRKQPLPRQFGGPRRSPSVQRRRHSRSRWLPHSSRRELRRLRSCHRRKVHCRVRDASNGRDSCGRDGRIAEGFPHPRGGSGLARSGASALTNSFACPTERPRSCVGWV